MAINNKKEIKDKDKNKDIILFIDNIFQDHINSVKDLEKILGRELKIYLLANHTRKLSPGIEEQIDKVFYCNIKKSSSIEDTIIKFYKKVLIVMHKSENSVEFLSRVAPFFPYIRLPNVRSLKIASDKLEMRRAFRKYAPKISPKFILVKKYTDKIVKDIIKDVGFPCVIKPTNLSKSKLIVNCYYKEELEKNLKMVLKKVRSLYKQAQVELEPQIIVEQFMEGQMYSIDAYINPYGKLYYTPIIEIKTGKDAGYDDLFMYTQIVPSVLSKEEEIKAREVVEKASHAIGLRSSPVHCELMKTSKGWKVIELAARCGGYRDELLYYSVGIKHHLNDLLIHIGNKPIIKKSRNRHAVFMKFWPFKAGKLTAIKGLKKAKELKSLVKFRQNKKIGDFAGLSKNGHLPVVAFTLSNKNRSDLLGNIRKLEKWIKIETSRNGKLKKTKAISKSKTPLS